MKKICFLDAKTLGKDIDLAKFEEFGEVEVNQVTNSGEITQRLERKNIVVSNKVVLNRSNLRNASDVELICVAATGTNNIDIDYAKTRQIAVTNVAGYSTSSVAQHTFAMLFYLLEHLSYYDNYVKSKKYSDNDIFTHLEKPFWELKGKTWGIIGLGSIGRTVASTAGAFGCEVIYYSTTGCNNNPQYRRTDIKNLLAESDIVSIHAPLSDNTRNLINYDKLKLMKNQALILNLGRGTIVNENDLAKALNEGLIAGAALDVLANEPIEEGNPLLELDCPEKILITPHIAWASNESRMALVNEIYLNIDAYLKGKERNRIC